MKIRRAINRDVEPVRALLTESFLPTYAPLIGRMAADALHERWHAAAALHEQIGRADGVFLIAEDETGLVAHGYASEVRPSVLIVFRLYVAPRERGRGTGSAVLQRLCAERPSASLVRLHVLDGNDRALAFFERRGFRDVGRTGADGLVSLRMERAIPG